MPKAYLTIADRQDGADKVKNRLLMATVEKYRVLRCKSNQEVAEAIGYQYKCYLAAVKKIGSWKLERLRKLIRYLNIPVDEITNCM